MTKVFKNILISLCGVFAFMFAGFFFVGCNVDYNKIRLICEQSALELDKGQSAELLFTIENYQSGFSNKVKVNEFSDGQTSVFSCSDPVYMGEDKFKITVTAVAGGSGRIEVKTLEADKQCIVDITVNQTSTSMNFENKVLYVSNKTPFVPTSDYFKFDSNTTNKTLSHFYFVPVMDNGSLVPKLSNDELKGYTLSELDLTSDTPSATFIKGQETIVIDMISFDKISMELDADNNIKLFLHSGQGKTEIDLQNSLQMFSIYDHSLLSGKVEDVLFATSYINVLPDLDVTVKAGYIKTVEDEITHENKQIIDYEGFENGNFYADYQNGKIRIVPNNKNLNEFMLRIEMNNLAKNMTDLPLVNFKINKSNQNVNIDFVYFDDGEEQNENVRYLKISQDSQTQASTDFSFEIMYNIAQDIEDESVNFKQSYTAKIEIAPIAITANGSTEFASKENPMTLYNFYKFPDFGWNELLLDVISGLETSPNFEGVYLEFDSSYLNVKYDKVDLGKNDVGTKILSDLSKPFYIRGAYDCPKTPDNEPTKLTIRLRSDILEGYENNEITLDLYFNIVEGAKNLQIDEDYKDYNKLFTLDYNAGTQDFSAVLYVTGAKFLYSTYKLTAGSDVVTIDTHNENPLIVYGDKFGNYLNLSVTPKAVGTGIYNIYLDNGMTIDLTFTCKSTLQEKDTSIQLSSEENDAVTEFSVTSDGTQDYNNVVNLEILNSSTKNDISFGSAAYLDIIANTNRNGVKILPRENGIVSVAALSSNYRISTLRNGLAILDVTINGDKIEKFKTVDAELKYVVYVTSYSLLEEFYLKNGDNFALNNTIYYDTSGNVSEDDKSVSFSVEANNTNSFNFYKYDFSATALPLIFNNSTATKYDEKGNPIQYRYNVEASQVEASLLHSKFDNKYIYFTAQKSSESIYPSILATLTKVDNKGKSTTKEIQLVLQNRIMFYAQEVVFEEKNELGEVLNTYTLSFSNMTYSVSDLGEFNLENFTYRNKYPAAHSLVLNSYIRQRNLTKRYDANIDVKQYQSVENISLASSISKLNFSNNNLKYTLGVYTYPAFSTNKLLRVDIIRTKDNPYSMVKYKVDYSDRENGVFTVELSCEDFFRQHQNDIVNIENNLTGKIYIYPAEWGDAYSSINPSLKPIEIDFQYRNGSKNNPYLLETVEDIQNINSNEITLRSHYELATVIDMFSVQNFTPIGILKVNNKDNKLVNKLVGFSGSIVGSTSQAAITNVVVTKNNFTSHVDLVGEDEVDFYASGLFAQINSTFSYEALLNENGITTKEQREYTPNIENLSVTGRFDLTFTDEKITAYVGLLSAINQGEITNVGIRLSKSSIKSSGQSSSNGNTIYYGGFVGVNYGKVSQDFHKFDGTGYEFVLDNEGKRQFVKNNETLDISKYDGSGYLYKTIEVTNDAGDKIEKKVKVDVYGDEISNSRDYTGQSPKILAYYLDFLTIDVRYTNVFAGGIVGMNGGEVRRIYSDKLALYGYSSYSSYTLINVLGQTNSPYNNIAVGGAVGLSAFYKEGQKLNTIDADNILTVKETDSLLDLPKKSSANENKIENLLIGGEINTSGVSNYLDYVGGIVGFADTYGLGKISINNNTSRMFLRARHYVGGIVGFEIYGNNYNTDVIVTYDANSMESVDDGRNDFYAASTIKYLPFETGQADAISKGDAFFAVGNATRNGKSYEGVNFTTTSYLQRQKSDDVTLYNGTNADAATRVSTDSVSKANYYGDYIVATNASNAYIYNQFFYTVKNVDIGLSDDDNEYKMNLSQASADAEKLDVYFMYYFSAESRLIGQASQEELENLNAELNTITPGSKFYPFKLSNQEVSLVSSNPEILSFDINGNITLRNTGLAVINITSIVNTQKSKELYIFVVNYFDISVSSSLFYTSRTVDGVQISDESTSNVYGNSNASLHLVPTYSLDAYTTVGNNEISISQNGVLHYNGMEYVLEKNSQLTIDEQKTKYKLDQDGNIVYETYVNEAGETVFKTDENGNKIPVLDDYFSVSQINKQTIIFYKNNASEVLDGQIDKYLLIPMLQVTIKIGEKTYTFVRELSPAKINLNVRYKERATSIRTNSNFFSMQSNNHFSDTVTIESTNKNEFLFYQIFYKNGTNSELVQSRFPENIDQMTESEWKDYINFEGSYANNANSSMFFDLKFERSGTNVFDFSCKVNTQSTRYSVDRLRENIFGEYTVYLYASELDIENAVSYSFKILLEEAELNYVSISNYPNLKDISTSDQIVVPAQRGLLEIVLDPVEANFNEISISNNSINYLNGAAEATFTFVYEKVTPESVEYVLAPNFGTFKNGTLQFSYQDLKKFIEELNEELVSSNSSVNYTGKIFVSYFMPSNNVNDMQKVGFNVNVTYGNGLQMPAIIYLDTKLGSFAALTIDGKEEIDGKYYVARGLDYDLKLNYFGFTEDQISISSSNSNIVNVSKIDGKYVLNVTPNSLSYNNDNGYRVDITTTATKTVDGVSITVTDKLELYVMEYVLNYNFKEGKNEDIVKGMENGVIYTAVGNPFKLEFEIRNFLEYNKNISVVNEEVETFITSMTNQIDWNFYLNNQTTALQNGKTFKNEYVSVNSFTVTPLKVYSAGSKIYYFSADAFYSMKNGVYSYSEQEKPTKFYTEFSFEVHEQSAEDSPIPVRTYNELMNMQPNEYYILLADIVIPNNDYAKINNLKEFVPITTNIAGLDGNGFKINFSGTYNFSGLNEIGLFETVSSDTVLKNITIDLVSSVVFKLDVETFIIGLLAASNDGVVTNCMVSCEKNYAFSVESTAVTSSSYVAALVGTNSGYITNSRSQVNIISNVHLSGFVGINSETGLIASSYFLNGSLNSKTANEFTAGFVIENNGEIYTSYVSGLPDSEKMYYDGEENFILSSNNVAGFAYTNTKIIEDCYSNIKLIQSGAFASGFVFENSGDIRRCFSTSVFENEQSSNYGFARANYLISKNYTSSNGTMFDCYYLQDEGINESIGEIKNDGVQVEILPLKQAEFQNLDNFSNFIVENGRTIHSVWFYNDNSSDRKGFDGKLFNTKRIELVAPNIIARSVKEFDHIETVVDSETGVSYAKYIYVYKSGEPALGSTFNPIIIENAENMEEYILQENNNANYNDKNYRLVKDVDYGDYLFNSQIYKTKFLGYFEGNHMKVSGITLLSSEAMNYAGMFAEIGKSNMLNAYGTVMNFTLIPNVVSFSNTNVVGALAGKVDGGKIYNVDVKLSSENAEKLVVVGKNIVGGAIGVAQGNYSVKDLNSELSAKARTQANSSENNFSANETNLSIYSFAGSLIGVASGTGIVDRSHLTKNVSVLGDKAGLMFGFVDESTTVSNLVVDMSDDMLVNAYSYGGLVVGETKGTVQGVEVNSNGTTFENFKKIPFIPKAVGGFAGLVSGGTIDNISVKQSIKTSSQSDSTGIRNLGGLVGEISKSSDISNIYIENSLTGFEYVGAIAGTISSKSMIRFTNITVNDCNLSVYGLKVTEIGFGGIAGELVESGVISLTASTSSHADELSQKVVTEQTNLDANTTYVELKEQIKAINGELALLIGDNLTAEQILSKENLEKELKEKTKQLEMLEENLKLAQINFDEFVNNEGMTNYISIGIASNVYVYGAGVNIYASPIVGSNKSGIPLTVKDTLMKIKGSNISVVDLSGSYSQISGQIIVREKEEKVVLDRLGNAVSDQTGRILYDVVDASATRTKFFCDVTFTASKREEDITTTSYSMFVNLHGLAALEKDI